MPSDPLMRLAGLTVLAWIAAAPVAAGRGVPFTAEAMLDLVEFVRGSEPILSPDGELAAYSVVDTADETNIRALRPTGWLRVISVRNAEAAPPLLEDERGDTPVWSPDGRRLAFLRIAADEVRLGVWERESGNVREIGPSLGTDRAALPMAARAPQWTPDGRAVILPVHQPQPDPSQGRVYVLRSSDPIVPGDAPFTDSRLWALLEVEVATGRVRTLTPEPVALRSFRIAPDGAHVLFRAVTPETLGRFRREVDATFLAALDPRSEASVRPALSGAAPAWVTFGPDGQHLLFAEDGELRAAALDGNDLRTVLPRFPEATQEPVWSAGDRLALLAARPGTGPPDAGMYSILRPVQDVIVVDPVAGAMRTLTDPARDDEIQDLVWSGDGRTLVYRAIDQASYRETLYRWTDGMPAPEPALSADEALGAVSASRDGGLLAFTAMSAVQPADGYVLRAGERARRRLTRLNPEVSRFRFVAPEVLDFHSADGEPLQALLFLPEEAGPDRPVPVVTFVYEKLSSQRNRFNPDAQFHATGGYAYLMPDVLVKPGYTGESFVKCVVPAVHAVLASGVSTGRVGITGGSFGGYAGLFLITQVDIFAAAVVRAPPSEFFSTWADGRDRDVWTIETGQARTGGTPFEVPERYIANSPFFHAHRVRTPVLILHGEQDYTVPFEQGAMMFHALRQLGRTAELVAYREGDHSIVRGSRADFLDVYARTVAWWERYLGPGASGGR